MLQRVDWNPPPSSREQCTVGRVRLHHVPVMKEATPRDPAVTSATDHSFFRLTKCLHTVHGAPRVCAMAGMKGKKKTLKK